MCANESGDTVSADSSAANEATSTTDNPSTATDTTDEPTTTSESGSSGSSDSSGSSSSNKSSSKKKSKAWIAGAVAGPLIGIAVIAAVVFFLFVVKKKKKANTTVGYATVNTNQQNGAAPGGNNFQQSAMAPAPQMNMAPTQTTTQFQDNKTPAYTQHYDVPTPLSSPPPQWTPASPAATAISPVPVNAQPMYAQQPAPPAQQSFGSELHAQSVSPAVSPMNTGNGGYGQQMHQPQPVRGNAMELPTTQAAQPGRGGAQELSG
jgi:hypothetical protein